MFFAQTATAEARQALSHATHAPVWWQQPPLARAALPVGESADIFIVGGGFTGLWTAVRAKQRDPNADVVLVDAGRIAIGASGRNGGFVSASITHGHANGIAKFADEFATLYAMGKTNLQEIAETISSNQLDCDFHQGGDYSVAVEPWQVAELQDYAEMVNHHGVPVEFLSGTEMRARVNSESYLAGIYDPEVALVNPAKLAWELARLAEQLGVRIYEHTAIQSWRRQGARIRVASHGGSATVARLVLATGAYQPLLRRISLFTLPVFDHVVATAPLTSDQLAAIGWDGRQGLSDAGNQFHYYRLTADNRIVWGGYDAVYRSGETPGSTLERDDELSARLVTHLHQTFPLLGVVPIEYAWAGAIDTCSRLSPYWGTAAHGQVVFTSGYTGLGVGSSRFGADVMLDLAFGEKTPRTQLRMVRHYPMPFPPPPMRQKVVDWTRSSLIAADANQGQRNAWLQVLDRVGINFDT